MKRLLALTWIMIGGTTAVVLPAVAQPTAGAPIAWGAPSDAKGCVIFREVEKLDVASAETSTTVKSRYELEVLESEGYTPARKSYPDTQQTLDELQLIAVQDRIRFVKIADPYTPADLDAARALCRQASASATGG